MSLLDEAVKRFNDDRYLLAFFGFLVFGVTLLVFKDLDAPLRTHFAPAVAVYAIGASYWAYLQAFLSYDAEKRQKDQFSNRSGFKRLVALCMCRSPIFMVE